MQILGDETPVVCNVWINVNLRSTLIRGGGVGWGGWFKDVRLYMSYENKIGTIKEGCHEKIAFLTELKDN